MLQYTENLAENAKKAYFAKVFLPSGETVAKPKTVKAFSAKGFPAITFGDYEKNVDYKGFWVSYITERIQGLTFVQGTRYYSIFSRMNRFSGKFCFVCVLHGRTEIFAAKNLYEIKALVKVGHLGRNRAILRDNAPKIDLNSLTFVSYHKKGQKTVYKCKVKKLGNMPKDFVLWR